MSQAYTSFHSGLIPPGTFIATLEGNVGGLVGPTAGGDIQILGSGNILVSGNPATHILTITFSGILPIANGGTNNNGALWNPFGTFYYDGLDFETTTVGVLNQVLMSNGPGVAPSYQSISAAGAAVSFPTDAGTATPVAGILNILGGSNIGTTGAANNVTVNLDSTVSITGTMTALSGLGAGAVPSTSGLVVSMPNRIGAWITGTNISAAGVDADGLFIDTSFAPTLSITNAADIGLYPTFNPPGGVTISNGYGLYIASGTQGGAGAVTTGYGLFVAHPTFGSTNYAAQIDNIRLDVNTISASNVNGTLDVNSNGVGTLSIGTNATAHSTVIGSTTAAATTTIQAPSAGVILTGVQGVAVANKNYVTINTATGAIGSDAGAASSISITGNSGGALVGNAFTFTGGTTGLTFTGGGTTETLTGTLAVANGGTGATGLTGIIIGNGGLSAMTATTITQHDVLIGGVSNAITSVAPSATSGIPLISQGAAADPAFGTAVVAGGGTGNTTFTAYSVITAGTTATGPFQNVVGVGTLGQLLVSQGAGALPLWTTSAATTITLTGNSGGALTSGSFTLTGGTTGLTFAGAGSTETLGGTLAIANGGTNATSFSVTDGTIYYDGTRLISTATGTVGQFLRSGGVGVAPAYATLPASSISITGDTGGALSGAAFTFSGGTTGLSFGGSGSTETLTFAGITANGGTVSLATDATTSTINVGTGAGVKTTTIGSTNTTSSTTINFGGSTGSALSIYKATTSFTPVLAFGGASVGITYNTQLGSYSQIGSIVSFIVNIDLSSKGSSTGSATITGLPVSASTSHAAAVRFSNLTFVGQVFARVATTTINLEVAATTGAVAGVQNTAFSNTTTFIISGSYLV